MPTLVDTLRTAHARRGPLLTDARTTAFRVLHGEADGVPDVTADRFGGLYVLSLYRDFSPTEEEALLDAAMTAWAPTSLYLKRRPREARVLANVAKETLAPETSARGEPVESLTALENGLSFLIRPGQGLSVGLYLDMRDTRAWLLKEARGLTVLNLFAYTCAFGVVAKAGGAKRALNLDASRRVLEWGEENAQLNGQPVDRYDYVAGDVFDWLKRLAKKGETFDLVIADPPSFSNTKEARFSAARDYARLAEATARVVAPGGRLVACCNHAGLPARRFEAMVSEGLSLAGRQGRAVDSSGPSSLDFPSPPGQEPALKVHVVQLR
ncbi:class I SAM-dependent rRNA methyltransferase [Myxococcus sp. CA051A]|uniref:class I SAM-dependent rRNA methyltransferase n=1 Tax=unclassified Myxococcus TaxID=2648731 RepID=UPI00157A9B00|nr:MULTISPECIES: class I SAM-dependent rRNA methyltransferase [unclassified Myxococcus]NTX12116.1 class I SAM-dependent rRNA methyltransferase [Myxococcus sp. CA056]NTX33131.1 class I SAM-dependent rRNA methyltransferase [Myxococcus sp. CA033]NTX59805.1 class I SAM-dependent rRNA methyltransferase [Myxococcus sp. CA051A]